MIENIVLGRLVEGLVCVARSCKSIKNTTPREKNALYPPVYTGTGAYICFAGHAIDGHMMRMSIRFCENSFLKTCIKSLVVERPLPQVAFSLLTIDDFD
jgi:hypothetical protein